MKSNQYPQEQPVFLSERLLESCEDDLELAHEVIQDFQQSAPRGLARLVIAVTAGGPAQIRLEAHSLKGISRTIGADALAASAACLEAAGKSGDLAYVPILLAEAERQLAALRTPLAHFLKG